jgi:hypothetical protein
MQRETYTDVDLRRGFVHTIPLANGDVLRVTIVRKRGRPRLRVFAANRREPVQTIKIRLTDASPPG